MHKERGENNSDSGLLTQEKLEARALFHRLRKEVRSEGLTVQEMHNEVQNVLARLNPRELALLRNLFAGTEPDKLRRVPEEAESLCENHTIESPLKVSSATYAVPPLGATFLLLLVPQKYREYLLGDLEEEYREVVLPRCGIRKANLWYWWQVLISLLPIIWDRVKRLATLSFLWKLIR